MRSIFLCVTAMVVLMLSSCMPREIKPEDMTVETVYYRSDGSVQVGYLEEFFEKYYSVDELKNYVLDDISRFNKNIEDTIKLESVTDEDGIVKVVLTFKNIDILVRYNNDKEYKKARFLNRAEALKEYGNTVFKSVEDGKELLGKELITDDIITMSGHGGIKFQSNKKILFYKGGKLEDSNHIILDIEGENVVLFPKC